jgi:hypothetical protein
MSLIDFALGLEGAPQQVIDDVDKALPGFARVAADLKQAAPILKQIQPQLAQLWAIWQKAQPDIFAEIPVAQEVIDVIQPSKGI